MTDNKAKTFSGRLEFTGVTHKEDEKRTISKTKMGKPTGIGLTILGVEAATFYLNAQAVGYFNPQTGDFVVGKNGRVLTALNIVITPEYADENPELVAHMKSVKAIKAKK